MTAIDRKGNISKAFSRMKKLLSLLQKHLQFERDSRFGFLTFDPAGDVIKKSARMLCFILIIIFYVGSPMEYSFGPSNVYIFEKHTVTIYILNADSVPGTVSRLIHDK